MDNLRQNRIQSFAFVFVVCVALCVSCLWAVNTLGFSISGDNIRLDSLINPNDAAVESLMRLPGIGLAKAEAIMAYRENVKNSESQPFRSCQDLQKVKGIGPKTAESIGEWLRF